MSPSTNSPSSNHRYFADSDEEYGDTTSQRSVSLLSSAPTSPTPVVTVHKTERDRGHVQLNHNRSLMDDSDEDDDDEHHAQRIPLPTSAAFSSFGGIASPRKPAIDSPRTTAFSSPRARAFGEKAPKAESPKGMSAMEQLLASQGDIEVASDEERDDDGEGHAHEQQSSKRRGPPAPLAAFTQVGKPAVGGFDDDSDSEQDHAQSDEESDQEPASHSTKLPQSANRSAIYQLDQHSDHSDDDDDGQDHSNHRDSHSDDAADPYGGTRRSHDGYSDNENDRDSDLELDIGRDIQIIPPSARSGVRSFSNVPRSFSDDSDRDEAKGKEDSDEENSIQDIPLIQDPHEERHDPHDDHVQDVPMDASDHDDDSPSRSSFNDSPSKSSFNNSSARSSLARRGDPASSAASVKRTSDSPVKKAFGSPATNSFSALKKNFESQSPAKKTFESPVRKTFDSPVKRTFDTPVKKSFDSPVKKAFDSPAKSSFDSLKKTFDSPAKSSFGALKKTFDPPAKPSFNSSPKNAAFSSPKSANFGASPRSSNFGSSPRNSNSGQSPHNTKFGTQALEPDTDSDEDKGKGHLDDKRVEAHSDEDDDGDVQEIPLSGAKRSFQLDDQPRSPSDDEHHIPARSPPRDVPSMSPAIVVHPKSPSFHDRSRTPSDDGDDIQDVPLSASPTRPSFAKGDALRPQHDSDSDDDDVHHTIPLSASLTRPAFKGLSLRANRNSDDEHDAPLSARPGQMSFNIPLSARPEQTSFGNLPSPPAGRRDSGERSPPFHGQDSGEVSPPFRGQDSHDLTPPGGSPGISPEVSDDEDDVQEIPLSPSGPPNRFVGIPLEIPSGKRDFSSMGALSAVDTSATPTNRSLATPTTRSIFGALRSPQAASHPTPPSPSLAQRELGKVTPPSPPAPATPKAPTPPSMTRGMSDQSDSVSVTSSASSARKARPDSVVIDASGGPLLLGIAVVDFNHIVGPQIEFSEGDIFMDEEVAKIVPFLALPDGAHLSAEDYSYFHLVSPHYNSTVFGISCNRQIETSTLLSKEADVTRSTVQKAIVILASKPVFGPVRDKLGVVTQAFFNQRNFRETAILTDFYAGLENSVRSQLTESGFYMGTSLRELVHTFRHRTLTLVKALMLQKKIMFYGHPVDKLCTYQYSLVSLLPELLQTLQDCGTPQLSTRAPTLRQPTELRTSDRKSLFAYMGLPLDIFGEDAFFQPYLPLQQMDMMQNPSWLCGSTNSIVTNQKDVSLLVNIEQNTFEFRDPKLERAVVLTPADRAWIDDIVRDVNDGWNENDPTRPLNMTFKGSDDYIRSKFEEYITASLSSIKYQEFIMKANKGGVMMGAEPNTSTQDYGPEWMAAFRETKVYSLWNRTTDPMLFDIIEAKHPCPQPPTVISDMGLRLQEGIHELGPTREAISSALANGSSGLFRAFEGVKSRMARAPGDPNATAQSPPPPPTPLPATPASKLRPLSLARNADLPPPPPKTEPPPVPPMTNSWGSWAAARFSMGRRSSSSSVSTTSSLPRSPLVPENAAIFELADTPKTAMFDMSMGAPPAVPSKYS